MHSESPEPSGRPFVPKTFSGSGPRCYLGVLVASHPFHDSSKSRFRAWWGLAIYCPHCWFFQGVFYCPHVVWRKPCFSMFSMPNLRVPKIRHHVHAVTTGNQPNTSSPCLSGLGTMSHPPCHIRRFSRWEAQHIAACLSAESAAEPRAAEPGLVGQKRSNSDFSMRFKRSYFSQHGKERNSQHAVRNGRPLRHFARWTNTTITKDC